MQLEGHRKQEKNKSAGFLAHASLPAAFEI
jgi:hypothetical protein